MPARRPPSKKISMHVGPNMTPMVDIVLCILIFFMLGAGIAVPDLFLTSNTAVDKNGLGSEVVNTQMPSVRMNITLKRQGNDTVVSAFDSPELVMSAVDDKDQSRTDAIGQFLVAKKSQLSDDVQIIILPDRFVPYQDVITIYNFCVKAQYKQVAFAAAQG